MVSSSKQSNFSPLPMALTSFVGRDEARAAVRALLTNPDVRLITLTGPGGVGKTRLALEVANTAHALFADGICFVPLAAVNNPELVMQAIAHALGEQAGKRPMFEMVQSFLQDKQVLLVLDNFEQVIVAAPSLAALLSSCPDLKLLVTSREALQLQGEYEFPVVPLEVPALQSEEKYIAKNVAVQLFVQRAQAHQPTFHVNKHNARALSEICTRLDGLPLALELAAARIKLLPPHMLLARLSQRLSLLTGGRRDAPIRHQTLRSTIKWSYDLLNAREQRLFRRLCIFVGGCTLQAVEGVYEKLDEQATDILDGIPSLLSKSLIVREELEDEEVRFHILETIREFGLECLQECGEMERVQQAHAHYYLDWAEANRRLAFGVGQKLWLQRYLREEWNWRAAMKLFLQRPDKEDALKLAGGLSIFWLIWGYSYQQVYLIEGTHFLEQALKGREAMETTTRAWALSTYGGLLAMLRDNERAEAACREGLTLARRLQDSQYIITALWMLLLPVITRDDFPTAHSITQEAIHLARTQRETFSEWEDSWLLGYSLHRAGYVALWQGRYSEARQFLSETMSICGQVGELFFALWTNLLLCEVDFFEGRDDELKERLEQVIALYHILGAKAQIAEAQGFLGLLLLRHGEKKAAHVLLTESVKLRIEVADEQGVAWGEIWLARVERAYKRLSEARRLLERGLPRAIQAHSRLYTSMGLEELATVVALQGESVWAAQLFGAAEALREKLQAPKPPVERSDYEAQIAALRATLGESHFHMFWTQGRSMEPAQALAMRDSSEEIASPPVKEDEGKLLSKREREVLHLLAEGLPNVKIAERLMLSPVTINSYLRTIYSKLGVSSRTQAVHYALHHHLL
jgi:predicted ATPase/DNA-binding CsgD family transcriptional regulator